MEKSKSGFLAVSKRTLLFVAGLIWSFAGFRVMSIGKSDVLEYKGSLVLILIFSVLIFYIFFNFIFRRMFVKHTKRIINSKLQKQCVFSFFDVKGYLIMTFMIFFGITIRSLGIFNPIAIGIFYIGLGTALLLAGITFLISSINFEKTKVKYTI